uniref:Uncharacterized protein n=1 Tax=Hyaloperonospora arabidopsidis (strain Emoy2) TaxID=559515 RepID=M4BHI9_HYAAE
MKELVGAKQFELLPVRVLCSKETKTPRVTPLHDILLKVNIKYEYCVKTNIIFSQATVERSYTALLSQRKTYDSRSHLVL